MSAVDAPAVAVVDHVSGQGPPMLLVHGGSGSHRHWSRVVAPLARSFRVHTPDLPGFGESPALPGDPDGDAYVAAAAELLSPLVPDDVNLVGFSFGGAIAAGVARAWGRRVRRLTLIGPGGFGKPAGRQIAARSRSSTDGSDAALRDVARHNLAAMMFADPAKVDDAVVDDQMWNLAHTRFDSLRVSFQDRLLADLGEVTCPVQVIWGELDVFAHPSQHDRGERIRAVRPDAQLHVVPGAGHLVQHENPDAIVRLLNEFHAPASARTENA